MTIVSILLDLWRGAYLPRPLTQCEFQKSPGGIGLGSLTTFQEVPGLIPGLVEGLKFGLSSFATLSMDRMVDVVS